MIYKILFKVLKLIIKKHLFKNKIPIQESGTVTYQRLMYTFKDKMKIKDVFISDKNYKTLNIESAQVFLKNTLVDLNKYVAETYDCDNFSFSLMGSASNIIPGFAFGIAWVNTPEGKHAMNVFVDEKFEVYYIEPQNDTITQSTEIKPYLIII